ncbi:hypothetical protein LSAT2_024944 [Lamellibrachia satsuma]|nr:hypothetical protein LSAT2_024944 [Lamellibrachia satsuma]
MCKEWAKTDCQKEHGKQKRVAEEEEEDQSCDGKTVSNEILKGQREMERVNNESGRSYQVTWTPPRKGAMERRNRTTRVVPSPQRTHCQSTRRALHESTGCETLGAIVVCSIKIPRCTMKTAPDELCMAAIVTPQGGFGVS